jgi:hypothetical protein
MNSPAPRSAIIASLRAWIARHSRSNRWVWAAALMVAVVAWGFADVRRRGLPWPDRPKEHKTDLTVFTEAGRAFFDGRAPYEVANSRGWKYLYPPLFAIVMAPLWHLPGEDQAIIWYFASVLLCWGCYRESAAVLRALRAHNAHLDARWDAWFPRLAFLALAACLLPALNCLQRGQVTMLKLFLLLLGLRLVLQARSWRGCLSGGIVLAASMSLKVLPVLPVALLLGMQLLTALAALRTGRSPQPNPGGRLACTATGVMAGLVLFLLVIPGALVGWRTNLDHLDTWAGRMLTASRGYEKRVDRYGTNPHGVRNQSLSNALYRLGNFQKYVSGGGPDDRFAGFDDPAPMPMDAPWFDHFQFVLRLGVLAALVLACVRMGLAGDLLSQATGVALACVGMLVLSPVAWGHYFMVFAPAVLLLPLWLDQRGQPQAAWFMAVVPAVLIVVHYLFTQSLGRIGFLGLGTTAWLLAAVWLVVEAGHPRGGGADRQSALRRPVFRDGRQTGETVPPLHRVRAGSSPAPHTATRVAKESRHVR